ncbi:MAG TPA: nuclease [Deltaproteobacteria bacterium]|nr:nuclease [Deltaproteobacteria bacterium]
MQIPLIEKLIRAPVSTSNFSGVEYVRNYDGDTMTVNIPGVHPLFGNEIGIRVRGIDTLEIRIKYPFEKQKVKETKTLIEGILNRANEITLHDIEREKYFRIVASVIVDGQNLSDLLLAKKLAVPYDG